MPNSSNPNASPASRAGRHVLRKPGQADRIALLNAEKRREQRTLAVPPGRDTFQVGITNVNATPANTANASASTENRVKANSPTVLAIDSSTPLSPSSPAVPITTARTSIGIGERASLFEGSLTRASAWTLLGSIFPGLGFIPTRFRWLGATLLSLGILLIIASLLWAFLGNPVSTLLQLTAQPWFLPALMIAICAIAILWISIIIATNRLHNLRERLQKDARVASAAFAYVLCLAIALPTAHALHSIWAVQNLVFSDTVFNAVEKENEFSQGADPWANRERVNIMLLGQDAGTDRNGTRPDTIMVASIDTQSGDTALFSIPRNLQWVRFPEGSAPAEIFPYGFDYYGENQNLINAIWTWAEEVRPDLFPGDEHPGRTATILAVEETLGLKINYYTMVNLQGFEDLVNAIGGVDIDVERDIPIGGGAGPITGYIEKGPQHLDGYHALWYARSREGSSDFDRICRQQRMIREITEEADIPTLALSVPRLLSATEKNIESNIPSTRLDAFTELALRVQGGNFESFPITPEVTNPGDPDFAFIKEWVQEAIGSSTSNGSGDSTGSTDDSASGFGSNQKVVFIAAPQGGGYLAVTDNQDDTNNTVNIPAAGPLASCMPGDDDPMN